MNMIGAGWLCGLLAAQAKPPAQPAAAAASNGTYANMPLQAEPFHRFRKPYQQWYVDARTLAYDGAARSAPDGDPARLKSIDIGFLGPLDASNYDSLYGIPMLHGAQMAIDAANARGGYHGKPFALRVHDDLPLWGASSMALVDMRIREKDWAMFGSVDAASTHIELRATLKLELPIMNTATNDPTETETRIPWLMHDFSDDRQQGYALADYIFNQRKLQNVGLLQVNNRYGREGDHIFFDTARRMGHQPSVVQKFLPSETDFSAQLHVLQSAGLDSVVIWADAHQAGLLLKQMRAMGMQQPVFASSRAAYPQVMQIAGPAAEGLVAVTPLDPTRTDPKWLQFRQDYQTRFHEEPDAYASYAFDGMNILLGAIQKAGLNRGRIMDALRSYAMKSYAGVSGTAFFDNALNNIAPVTFVQVRNGKFVYWPEQRTDWKRAPQKEQKPAVQVHPYASIAAQGAFYDGPGRAHASDLTGKGIAIGILAPLHGERAGEGAAMLAAARMALRDSGGADAAWPGHPIRLAVQDESGPSWAHISDALLHLVLQDQSIAVLTSDSGDAAHIGEQVVNPDATATEAGIPWVFRIGPSDAQQAQVFLQSALAGNHSQRVVLLTQSDHGGRVAIAAVQQAAHSLGQPAPQVLTLDPLQPAYAHLLDQVRAAAPQTILLWTHPQIADALVHALNRLQLGAVIDLSQESAQGLLPQPPQANAVRAEGASLQMAPVPPELWTVAGRARSPLQTSFARRFRQQTGTAPSAEAAQTYDAVRMIVSALHVSGANRARLRDQLAHVQNYSGVSGEISFDSEGNNRAPIAEFPLRLQTADALPQMAAANVAASTAANQEAQ
jgi:branched-chain amino acid transport system substrate-binding protein